MNFLAHLLVADRVGLPLAGAILGDFVRGRITIAENADGQPTGTAADSGAFPPDLARSIMLHRRIDTVTDKHPRVLDATTRFAPGTRRYAGVLLDLILDHALARDWSHFCSESLPKFASRAAKDVAAAGGWFERAGAAAPSAWRFRRLLLSYRREGGMETAIQRTAIRLRRPEGMLEAAKGWRAHIPGAASDLPFLLADITEAAQAFLDEHQQAALAG